MNSFFLLVLRRLLQSVLLGAVLGNFGGNEGIVVVQAAVDPICDNGGVPGCPTKTLFDALAVMQGTTEAFTDNIWNRLRTCMANTRPSGRSLLALSDIAWEGSVFFAAQNGTSPNTTSTIQPDPWTINTGGWLEHNVTLLVQPDDNTSTIPGGSKFLVNEPCNTVSNLAYYRTMLALCENNFGIRSETVPWLINTFAHQGWGSAIFHAGFTTMSFLADVTPTYVYAYIVLQNAVRGLPYNTVTHELSDTPRPFSSVETAQEFDRVLIEYAQDPFQWAEGFRVVRDAAPDFFVVFASIFSIGLILALPDIVALPVINLLTRALLDEEQANYNMNVYVPAFRQALQDANINVRILVRASLLRKGIGTAIKLLYSAIWQEETIPGPQVSGVGSNRVGGRLIPAVNAFANFLTRYNRLSDPGVQLAKNVYPSDKRCRTAPTTAHSKWHEMTANGLVDLLLLGEDINSAIAGRRIFQLGENEMFACFNENDCLSDFVFPEDIANMTEATINACVPQTVDDIPTTPEDVQYMLECLSMGEETSSNRKLWTTQDHHMSSCITLLVNPPENQIDLDRLTDDCQHRLSYQNVTHQDGFDSQWYDYNETFYSEYDTTQGTTNTTPSNITNGFAHGIPKLASCSALACRFSYRQMLASFAGMPACMNTCRQTYNAPHCIVGCYAGINFT